MADLNKGGRIRDPLEEGEDKSNRLDTSRSREESMTESGKDAFGDKSAIRNPDSTQQGDGTSDPADNTYIGRAGEQSPSSSPDYLSSFRPCAGVIDLLFLLLFGH